MLERKPPKLILKTTLAIFKILGLNIIPEAENIILSKILQGGDKNFLTKLSRISDIFIKLEDKRFYSHIGVDVRSILSLLLGRRLRGGATTIAMQLARVVVVNPHRMGIRKIIIRKIFEVVLGLFFFNQLGRLGILTQWLKNIPFGKPSIIGIEKASFHYLQKPIDSLDEIDGLILAERISIITGNYYKRRIERLANWAINLNLIRSEQKEDYQNRYHRMMQNVPGKIMNDLPNGGSLYKRLFKTMTQ